MSFNLVFRHALSELYILRASSYKRINDFDNVWLNLKNAIEIAPDYITAYLDTLEMFITAKTYKDGLEFIEKYDEKILATEIRRDKIIYLFLKGIIYIIFDKPVEELKNTILNLAKEEVDLKWYFGHTTQWNKNSDCNPEKKEKIQKLTEFVENFDNF